MWSPSIYKHAPILNQSTKAISDWAPGKRRMNIQVRSITLILARPTPNLSIDVELRKNHNRKVIWKNESSAEDAKSEPFPDVCALTVNTKWKL